MTVSGWGAELGFKLPLKHHYGSLPTLAGLLFRDTEGGKISQATLSPDGRAGHNGNHAGQEPPFLRALLLGGAVCSPPATILFQGANFPVQVRLRDRRGGRNLPTVTVFQSFLKPAPKETQTEHLPKEMAPKRGHQDQPVHYLLLVLRPLDGRKLPPWRRQR